MMKLSVLSSYFLIAILFCSCQEVKDTPKPTFDPESKKELISKLGKQWGIGLKSKDVSVFEDLYDTNGHYLPDGDATISGNKNIAAYWKASMDFITDIQLNMESLEGTEDILYETGSGIALIINASGGTDTLAYKYTNVWKLQPDGNYRVVIDMYNDAGK